MKTKKLITAFLLVFTGGLVMAHAQVEWFPIGATWHYQFGTSGWIEERLRTFTVEKDTVVNGKNARVIRGENHVDVVHEEDGRVYYYFQGRFRKIFDFNVNVGDTIEFEFKTTTDISPYLDTTIVLPMLIEKVSTRIIDSVELREITAFTIPDPTSTLHHVHVYIEKIGVEYATIQEGIFPVMPGWGVPTVYATVLRCYQDGDIEYILDWWARRGLPCDYDFFSSSIKQKEIDQDIVLYPNPVQSVLTVSSKTEHLRKVTISIHNAAGKVVFEREGLLPYELNVEYLQSGIYFIRIFDENLGRLTANKFIKK